MTRTKAEGLEALRDLTFFLPPKQAKTVRQCMAGEEAQFFIDKMCELRDYVQTMPLPYETNGQGDNAIVYLHYFNIFGTCHHWITEKDDVVQQNQSHGYAHLRCRDLDQAEIGYISIAELLQHPGTELDFHFTPATLGEWKEKYRKENQPHETTTKGV